MTGQSGEIADNPALAQDQPSGAPPPAQPAPLPPNEVFKSEMGKVSFGILVLAVLSLAVLFVMAVIDAFGTMPPVSLMGDLDALSEPTLHWPWDAFVWLVASGGILAKIIAALSAIVTVGIGVIAETTRNRWLALSIICLCLAGALLSVLLMWQLSDDIAIGWLRSPTNLTDAQFLTAVNSVLGGFALWFLAFLGRQVGIDGFKAVAEMIKGWIGGGR